MSMNRFGVATALAVGGFLAAPAMGGITGMSYDYVSSSLTGGGDYWTVRVYADLTPGARVDAVAGNSQQSKVVSTSGTFYQNINAGPTSKDLNCNFFGFDPDMEWDSYVTIGCLCADGSPFGNNNLNNIGIDWVPFEDLGGTIDANNGTWFVTADDAQGEESGGRVLVGQFTILGDSSTSMTFEALFQGREADTTISWGPELASITIPAPAGPADCNDNGVEDADDIADGTSQDCNGNAVPDECDIESGNSNDCDNNGTPDECQGDDCDGNGVPDACDLAGGAADCDNNGILDSCDLDNGAADCNNNGVPDTCDIAGGSEEDCDENGVPDSCDFANGGDANNNGVLDACEYYAYRNLDNGQVYDLFDDAAADAENGDRIEADFEAINAEDHVDFRNKALEVSVVNGSLTQPDEATMNLGNGSRLEGGDNVDIAGSVRSNGAHSEMTAGSTMTIASTGSMTVRENSAIEIDSPQMANDGEITVRDAGDLDLNLVDFFLNNGTLNSYGDAAIHASSFSNSASGDMFVSGHLYMTLDNSGSCQLTANTVLTGDLNNDGLVSAVAGQMYVLGDINNNGDIVGDVGDGVRAGGNLRVSGNFTAGADSSLILPAGWQLTVGGDCDIAIDESNRLVAIDGTIRMNLGANGASTIEAMSEDLGETLDGVVASNFAIGTLTIGVGKTVNVVDNRVNGEGDEIMYVETLIVEPGATFNGNGNTVWAVEIINNGTILGDVDVIDPAVPCDGNLNDDDVVNIDDLLIILGSWGGTGGDANNDGLTNIDDILVVLGNWGACS